MRSSLLTQFQLPLGLASFIDIYWEDHNWFSSFLSEYLEDLSVEVGLLENQSNDQSNSQGSSCNGRNNSSGSKVEINDAEDGEKKIQIIQRRRQVRSYHPSKVSFPGLPSHAEVYRSVYNREQLIELYMIFL